ncbi:MULTISPECIES: Holliday junction resolvase RuvX [unclassified Janthinobacterium]|jgi:putative Holliday junction resolvase|uniref:Holliday junction resolvase RuvX n=1 Tax=unclassified Janthinobacterium TaxID=2610881 RepID=UPI001612C8D3|nr:MULTISPECIES: Holliday junction resolvase RuvX [unclassified Janthinobacterium]MBB5607603.1 putative Holliday junction resolvase [Janthinobacterium sp. S3T4]MBB5612625.1 putative Holliday junction resolvase [Janthinobacterium sp. S3M3]
MSDGTIDTILAFDFGLKRIGVAIGNTMICQAKPLSVITATANEPKFAAIAELLKEWGASRIVVGLPSHPDGTEHEMSARCRRFANQVHGRFNLPVELVDERYSSAVISARRGEVIDDKAAAVILQQYFDANY